MDLPSFERELAEILLRQPMIILDPRDINNGIAITNYNTQYKKVKAKDGDKPIFKKIANFVLPPDVDFNRKFNYHFFYDFDKHKLLFKFHYQNDSTLTASLKESNEGWGISRTYFYNFMKINMLNIALKALIEQEKTPNHPDYPYQIQKDIIENEIAQIKKEDNAKEFSQFGKLTVEDVYLFNMFLKDLIKQEKRNFLLKEL